MLSHKKLRFVCAGGFVLLLLSGCTGSEPSFDPNNKGMVVVEGKTYRVPLEANYSLQPFQSEQDKGVVKGRAAGIDCRKGDIAWISSAVQTAAREAASEGDVNRAASIIIGAPRKGQIGCAHPLSKKQVAYYREKK